MKLTFFSILFFSLLFSTSSIAQKAISKKTSSASSGVKIGNQIWMNKSLDVHKFRNGDSVSQARSTEEWIKAREEKKPVWCYYNYDSTKGAEFGAFYNWYAVNDPRGLAPKGWHIPTSKEWDIMVEHIGGLKTAWDKIVQSDGWMKGMHKTSNSTGFSALGGGGHGSDGSSGIGMMVNFWSAADDPSKGIYNTVKVFQLYLGDLTPVYGKERDAMYVRCVKN